MISDEITGCDLRETPEMVGVIPTVSFPLFLADFLNVGRVSRLTSIFSMCDMEKDNLPHASFYRTSIARYDHSQLGWKHWK